MLKYLKKSKAIDLARKYHSMFHAGEVKMKKFKRELLADFKRFALPYYKLNQQNIDKFTAYED